MSKQHDKTTKTTPPKAAKPKAPPIQQQVPVDDKLLQLARQNPASLTPAQRTRLQRTVGNRGLGQLVGGSEQLKVKSDKTQTGNQSPIIQAKLTVNAVGDKYEQEADAVAKEVVQKLNAPQPDAAAGVPTAPPHAQRQTEEEEPIAQRIQRQAAPEEKEMQLQRQEMPEEEGRELRRQGTSRPAVAAS